MLATAIRVDSVLCLLCLILTCLQNRFASIFFSLWFSPHLRNVDLLVTFLNVLTITTQHLSVIYSSSSLLHVQEDECYFFPSIIVVFLYPWNLLFLWEMEAIFDFKFHFLFFVSSPVLEDTFSVPSIAKWTLKFILFSADSYFFFVFTLVFLNSYIYCLMILM